MPAVPFKVKAVFEYNSEEPDDLKFPNGQIITVTDDEDADWYTGEYTSTAGDKLEGLFPRNFVEKYEPAIPSRPSRTPRKVTAPEPPQEPAATQEEPVPAHAPEPVKEAEIEPPQQPSIPGAFEEEPGVSTSPPAAPKPAAAVPTATKATSPRITNTAPKPGPPPVAEKPSTNSFKDRIAAFNKTAAPPIAPFKPGGQNTASGFIKKPFVAPPPSKNSYVPPPREPPPQKIYRREEDPGLQHEEGREAPEPPKQAEEPSDDQPKPTSLKERIALLQRQQLEQAQRHAESSQRKEKPKKPPKKRVEPTEEPEPVAQDEHLEQVETNETVINKSTEAASETIEEPKPLPARQASLHMPTPLPPRELVSDTNDADDSGAGDTEDAQGTSTEEDGPRSKGNVVGNLESLPLKKEDTAGSEEEAEGDEEETEEEEDPEVRRKRELRERMAKMSGGMGMMGMFGAGAAPGAGASRKSRPSTEGTRQSLEQQNHEEVTRAPPVPIMALPGMSNQVPKKTEEPAQTESEEEDTAQSTPHESGSKEMEPPDDYVSQPPKRTSTGRSTASMPRERPVPPPPPREARAPPPPPPAESRAVPPTPPSSSSRPMPPPPVPEDVPQESGEESEDEDEPQPTPRAEEPPASSITAPPVPPIKTRPEQAKPPPPPRDAPQSPISSPQTRAPPPPPPPAQAPSRKSTNDFHGAIGPRPPADEDSEDEVTEYDGDYDTDIASSAKHKDALKSHGRDSSVDEGVLTDDAAKSPTSPPARNVPPVPSVSAPRDVPPPPPPVTAKSRKSTDAPRAPPPVPPPTQSNHVENDYDHHTYAAPQHPAPTPSIPGYAPVLSSPREEIEEEDMYGAATEPPRMAPPAPTERAVPPPPPPNSTVSEPPKQSLDAKRATNIPRRSMEQQRPSGEHGSIASDLDLGRSTFWWTQDNLPPPALQQRNDVLFEMESSTSSKRGGKTMVSKDIYILYQDYSQTTVNATFDASDPSHVTLEQSHERPPPAPRKDQLENASEQFGARIASAASSAASSSSTVGDGSAHGLILELFRPLESALKPIGTRAYGALVYANLANASTQQFDEIRPGDIITFRNAKFSGHKGNLHSKYSIDVGKPDHVAVVIDWDGTKKKVRTWEQVSREEKGKKAKVKEESYKMSDLKSGEVRVWRVMGRTWVGWTKG